MLTTCSRGRSSGCRSRVAGGRGLRGLQPRQRRSPAPRRCCPSTSPRRSRTGRRANWRPLREHRAAPWRFPARNRIIAGLAAATVIVEARERSGALITADFALEEGREVLAVPGEITSALSAGTNRLLQQGATPLLAVRDVLEVFGLG